MAADGLRVLAIAAARHEGSWPDDPAGLPFELVGLCALEDPLRADIPAAIAACRAAGLRVVMITGDHPDTAAAIARQAGLRADAVATGPELEALDQAGLAARLATVDVCARIVPEQKLAIVQALQRGGAVVGMTGDGVNDAPALRAADVGIAMGKRGTDVAREAAELTLLDDRFTSIVDAIAAGRRIFANMGKGMAYVAAIHVPIAGMALLPALFGWPVLLYPLHIVFLELVIDPACALVFENEPAEPDAMRRPPRARGSHLFGTAAIGRALAEGLAVLALIAGAYAYAASHLPEEQARAFGYAALVLANLALLLSHRGRGGSALAALRIANPAFWAIAGVALAMLAVTLYVPPAATLFRFAPPDALLAGAAAGVSLATVAVLELAGRLARRRHAA
jgi:Ca2+-transporting ATPase